MTQTVVAQARADRLRETLRRALAPTEPVVVIAATTEPGIPIPPPGPDASDEDVEAFVQGLCKRNPYM